MAKNSFIKDVFYPDEYRRAAITFWSFFALIGAIIMGPVTYDVLIVFKDGHEPLKTDRGSMDLIAAFGLGLACDVVIGAIFCLFLYWIDHKTPPE